MTDLNTRTDSSRSIDEVLDDVEARLPLLPSKSVALTRAAGRRTAAVASSTADAIGERLSTIGSTVATATRTTVGQARSAAERTYKTVCANTAEAFGQARAQTGKVVDTVETETADLLDDATDAVAPETVNPASLEDLSKSELYDRAQAAGIEGRSTMTKDELVRALRR